MQLITIKERSQTYQPLLLAEFTFSNGEKLRLSTQELTTTSGNVTYNGHVYYGRVLDYSIQPIGASPQGISMPASVSLTLADDDRWLYQNYEFLYGFGGAQLLLIFVFFDTITGTFSEDCFYPFIGTCSQPNGNDVQLQISALALTNMVGTRYPTQLVQRLCPYQFPKTAANRQDGADNIDSWYYQCGYSPDATGPSACGNYQSGTTPYTSCGYTAADCAARGMYTKDSADRQTGRFGGFQWDPPSYIRSESYIDDNWTNIFSDPNTSKYGLPVPVVFGKQWVNGLTIHTEGDANSTRAEVLVCLGRVTSIIQVICNGEVMAAATDIDGNPWHVADALFRYNVINNGKRSGAPCADAGFDSKGDPFGSMCVIEVVVPRSLVASPSSPSVQILVQGPFVAQFEAIDHITVYGGVATATVVSGTVNNVASNDLTYQFLIYGSTCAELNATWVHLTNFTTTTFSWSAPGVTNGTYSGGHVRFMAYSDSPVWLLYDLLGWGGFDYETVDIDTFIAGAKYCAASVSYTKSDGSTASHSRFTVGWSATDQRSLGEAVTECLATFGGMLVTSPVTGLLELRIKQTLAEQQPSPISGSNSLDPVTSMKADGTSANGYLAYAFDVGSILRQDRLAQVELVSRANSDLQNSYNISFQDSENQWVADGYTVTDTEAVARMGQVLSAALPGLPPTSYDQARRVANQMLGENLRCNARLDPSGSTRIQITSTFKAVHLRFGDIVSVTWDRLALDNQMFRVISVQPDSDWETAKIVLQWHEDVVWTDAYGQGSIPASRTANFSKTNGTPYPPLIARGWSPSFGVDALRPDEHGLYQTWSDAAWAISTNRTARFWCFPPINQFSLIAPPKTTLTGGSTSTGGVLTGGRSYWVWLTGEDANRMMTPPAMVRVDVPSGTNTNSLIISPVVWDPDTVAFHIWISDTPARPHYYGRVAGVATTISITSGLISSTYTWIPIPDPLLSYVRLKMKRILMSGIWEGTLTSATTYTLRCEGASWTPNQWVGRIVTMTGRADPTNGIDMPPDNSWLITANSSDTLTLDTGATDPTTLLTGTFTQCYIVIRFKASTYSSTTIGDSSLAMTAGTQQGRLIRILKGTGVGQTASVASNDATTFTVTPPWNVAPDATSIFWVEEPAWMSQTDYVIKNALWDYMVNITAVQYAFDITGLAKTHLMFQPLGLGTNGKETSESLAYPAISDLYFMLDVISESIMDAPGKINGIQFWIDGDVEVNADATHHLIMPSTKSFTAVGAKATLKSAPSGDALVADVKVNGVTWVRFSFASGTLGVTLTSVDMATVGVVPASAIITLAIVSVGSTAPGSDLSISIYS